MSRTEAALVGILVVAFVPALTALAGVWASVDYASHGFLVPVVSAFAAWGMRPRLARLPARRDGRGAGVLVAAAVLYAVAAAAGSVAAQGLAVVLAVAGAVWWLRGAAWLRALAFPVGFLIFMVPPPPDWVGPLIVKLQLFVSQAAVAVLHAVGIAVAREGNVLVLPGGHSLFVAEACSGITSIVTLTPLAVLLAWAMGLAWGRAALLVAAVVPVAMLANLLRVAGTVAAASRFGVERVTEGAAHELAGLAVYVGGCLLLVALAGVLAPPRRRAA